MKVLFLPTTMQVLARGIKLLKIALSSSPTQQIQSSLVIHACSNYYYQLFGGPCFIPTLQSLGCVVHTVYVLYSDQRRQSADLDLYFITAGPLIRCDNGTSTLRAEALRSTYRGRSKGLCSQGMGQENITRRKQDGHTSREDNRTSRQFMIKLISKTK